MAHSDPKASPAADRSRILEIDTEIDKLEKRLHLLRLERYESQERLDAYKYPVLTLPNEIVSEILVQSIPPYPLCPPLTGLSSPTLLTHICREWREIAISTPQLWRAVHVHCDGLDPHVRSKQVQTWLARSGSCPLSIQIDTDKDDHPLFDGIPLHQQRWERVVLKVRGHVLQALLKGPMPMLHSLSVTRMYEQNGSATLRLDVTPLDFTRLQTVSLVWIPYPVDWLPRAQVTSLTLEAMKPHTWIPMLRDAIHLVDLTLIDCEFSEVANEAPIRLAQLQNLVVIYDAVEFLNMIEVPALQTLQVAAGELGSDPIDTLGSLISRSGCGKLRRLLVCGLNRWESREVYRRAFPTIPAIVLSSRSPWYWMHRGDEENSDDSDSDEELEHSESDSSE